MAVMWRIRLLLTAVVASVMALIGYQLMFHEGPGWWRLDQQSTYFVLPSIALWLVLAPLLSRQTYVTAVGWGVVSPFLGSLLVAGPAGLFIVLAMWYATLPVGVVTGLLVRLCVSAGGNLPNPHKAFEVKRKYFPRPRGAAFFLTLFLRGHSSGGEGDASATRLAISGRRDSGP
jgi:hypothetical protein